MKYTTLDYQRQGPIRRRQFVIGLAAAGLSLLGTNGFAGFADAAPLAQETETEANRAIEGNGKSNSKRRSWWLPAVIAGIGGGSIVAKTRGMPGPAHFSDRDKFEIT